MEKSKPGRRQQIMCGEDRREDSCNEYSDEESLDVTSHGSTAPCDEATVFVRKLSRRFFRDRGNCLVDAKPVKPSRDDLKNLDGVRLLHATVGPLLIIGLRQLMKLRPPRPREWLAFFLLSRKGPEHADCKTTTEIMKSAS
jgi:hypothetical protein